MNKIVFTKMVASGNDFVVIESSRKAAGLINYSALARKICDRKFGVGADGLLILEKSKIADIRMRVFNADGSEAEMCGNGARCISLYLGKKNPSLETRAGVIKSEVNGKKVKVRLSDPQDIKLDLPVKINNRLLNVSFINTGVPHVVIFVEVLDKIDVVGIGLNVRHHKRFSPKGTNVNFVQVLGSNAITIRTYERGVEGETLSCGTGSVASALIFALKTDSNNKIAVGTKSKDTLTVYFSRQGNKFMDVWLEGEARIICKGVYNV